MWSAIALLPALAVLCHGAALPQVIGSPIPSAKPSTYTFVIPCPPGSNGCVPRTITMVGGAEIEPMTLLPREPQVLGDPTRTVLLPTSLEPTSKSHSKTKHSHTTAVSSTETSSVTSTHKHHHTTPTVDARQVLGSPTRTVPVAPTWSFPGWPWWPQGVVTVTVTKTITQIPDTLTTVSIPGPSPFSPTNDYYTPGVTRTVPALSVPLDRRDPQVLGEPTRTVLLPTPTKNPHTSRRPVTTWDDIEERQELGSPTRTVLVSPTPDPYPTVTVTITTTYYPTEPWHPWPTKPSPPWWVTTRYPTSDPEPITRTVPPFTVPISQRDPQVLGSPTRTVLLPTHKPHTSRRPVTTWNDVEERQELGDPTGSVSWYTGGDDGLTATVTLPGPTKRQVLGDPTQSFTWWEADDSEPTAPVLLEPPSRRSERREGRPRHL